MLSIRVFWIFVNLHFGTLNNKALITEIGFDLPVAHSHSALYPFVTEEAVRVHLIDSLLAWGYQGGDFAPFDSLGLPECILFALWQPGAARVHIMGPVTAWAGRVEILPSLPAF